MKSQTNLYLENIDMINFPLKLSRYVQLVDREKFNNEHPLLINLLDDRIVIISLEQYKLISKIMNEKLVNKEDFVNSIFIRKLFLYKFLIDNSVDEYKLVLHKLNQLVYRKDSLITAIVNLGCNLDCSYCFEKWTGEQELNSCLLIDDNFIETYIKFLKSKFNEQKYEHLRVAWFGGEPLLSWNKIVKVIPRLQSFTKNNNIKFTNYVVTNGVLINKIKLSDYSLLDFIQITIDGNEELHDSLRKFHNGKGSFRIIIENIKKIPIDFPIVLRINVSTSDVMQYKKVIDLLMYRARTTTIDLSPIFANHSLEKNKYIKLNPKAYIKMESEIIFYALRNNFKISQTLFPSWTNISCWRILPYAYHITTNLKLYNCVTKLGNKDDYYAYIDKNGNQIITNMDCYLNNKSYVYEVPKKCKKCNVLPICSLSCKNSDCTPYKHIVQERVILKARLNGLL